LTLVKYLFQGVTGQSVSEGTAATLANLGIPSGGRGIVNAGTGGSILFKASAKTIATYGLELKNGAGAANFVRFTPSAASGVMAVTAAVTVPNPLPTGANVPTIWNMVATTGTPLRLQCNASGHLLLLKVSGTSIDLGAFTAGQNVIVRAYITIGTGSPSSNGILNFELQNPGGSTISGTSVSVTNADLGNAVTVTDSALASTTGTPGTGEMYTVNAGYICMDDGRTSFIPQEANLVPAVDSGTILAIVSAGSFTAQPTGTLLANYSDSDPTTVVRSPVATSTLQTNEVSLPRINPKTTLIITPGWQKTAGQVGDGTISCSLKDGGTVVNTQTFNTATVGIPSTVTYGSGVTAGLTVDSGGAWAGLSFLWGVST